MSNPIALSPRDRALLGLLEMTPATAVLIRKAGATFPGEPFRDERRVRERVSALHAAGLIAAQTSAVDGGGAMHLYRLTREGYRSLHTDAASAARFFSTEVAPSRLAHSIATAEAIVHTLVAAHASRTRLVQFHGDGHLILTIGEYRQVPDCHFQFERGGKTFNLLFEIDNATEPLDSPREQSIRTKILGYELYQDWVLQTSRQRQRNGHRPVFRVVFLTRSQTRAYHILGLARQLARNPDRRLCYAATQDEYLGEPRALTTPVFNDHRGHWQSLVDLAPSAAFTRQPVRIAPPVARRKGVC